MMFDPADVIETFRTFAREQHGVLVPENLKIGRIGLCPVEGKKSTNRAGRYRLHLDGIAAGWVQNWTCEDHAATWCFGKKSDYSPADWAAYQAQVEVLRREREAEDARISVDAAKLANEIWTASAECREHAYLTGKGVHAVGLRATTREWRLPCRDGGDMIIPSGALVIPARDVAEKIHTLQFILDAKTKLFVPGAAKHGHFHTLGRAGDVICIAEGYATSASIHEATSHCVVVAFDCGNLLPVARVLHTKYPHARIVMCADDDWKTTDRDGNPTNPGVTKATAAAEPVGAIVVVPEFGPDRGEKDTDFNDLAAACGLPAVKRQIEAAMAPTANATVHRLRPEIVVGTDESRVCDEAIAALALAPEVYVRGPEIVEIVTDDPATRGVTRAGPLVRIHRSPEPRVRELLSDCARWMSTGRDGESLVEAHPPLWAVRAVVSRGHWPALRSLVGVAEAPTMRVDGTLLTEPGYDAATGIYLAPGVRVSIPDRPTRDQAIAAVAELAEIIADFPVASEAGRSAWLAGVVTAAARPAIDGPAPAIIVDASTAGAGKTLAADAAAVIVTGRPAARTTFVTDDAEMRKRITAIALAGDPIALLDNVVGTLGCPSLDAALTGTTWRDRVLGSSAMTAELPLRTVWWATGNGLIIGADLIRRALLIRLEPMCERPEERTGWRHPRLLDYVRDHRAALLGAALTIARAYAVAGWPDQKLTPMGSYTAWSDVVRSALVWAGLADPCATIAEIRACDPRADALGGLLATWPAAPDVPITVAELLVDAAPGTPWRAALTEWCPARGADPLPTARAVGNRLRGMRRRVVGGRYIDAGPHAERGVPWVLRTTSHKSPAADSLTLLIHESRYARDEQKQNRDIAGETVNRVIESGRSDDGPDDDGSEGGIL